MKIKNHIEISRLVAKIDNDFNISESDWIPRVAAWVVDALSQMKVLPTQKKKRKLEVSERVATFPCELNMQELKVYDSDGCEVPAADEEIRCCNSESTTDSNSSSDSEIAIIDVTNKTGVNFMEVATIVNGSSNSKDNHNFVVQGNCIELNFDDDYITVESKEVATYHDDYYDCDVPYIYEDGYLLEALAFYVLFKYLSRGSKHPVYDLKSNSPVTNPWLQWNTLRVKAAASVKSKISNDKGWRNFFYNSTFDPRNN